jgi:hypothetical protein
VTPSWCKIVDSLLLKARNTSGITMEIPSNVCFACQHKHDFLNVVTPLATTAGIIQDTSDAPLAVGSMLSKARRNVANSVTSTKKEESSLPFTA